MTTRAIRNARRRRLVLKHSHSCTIKVGNVATAIYGYWDGTIGECDNRKIDGETLLTVYTNPAIIVSFVSNAKPYGAENMEVSIEGFNETLTLPWVSGDDVYKVSNADIHAFLASKIGDYVNISIRFPSN